MVGQVSSGLLFWAPKLFLAQMIMRIYIYIYIYDSSWQTFVQLSSFRIDVKVAANRLFLDFPTSSFFLSMHFAFPKENLWGNKHALHFHIK